MRTKRGGRTFGAHPLQVAGEQIEHQGVGLDGPRAAVIGGEGFTEKLLGFGQSERGLVTSSSLSRACDLEEAMRDEGRCGGRSRPGLDFRRVAALVQQGIGADERRHAWSCGALRRSFPVSAGHDPIGAACDTSG
jgi:hypothetical protein